MLALDDHNTVLRKPIALKPSACTPLFYNAYTKRGAGACIHTHSQNAVLATLMFPGETFEISHQEMIKGIRKGSSNTNLRYFDRLVVPIVENTPEEEDLTDRMAYVNTNADFNVLIFNNRPWRNTRIPMPFLCGGMVCMSGEVRMIDQLSKGVLILPNRNMGKGKDDG